MITPIIVPMQVSTSDVLLPVGIGVTYGVYGGDRYEGETRVESHLYDTITLETKNKIMPDDVTVLPITILDVDNPAGGYTVTIGKF